MQGFDKDHFVLLRRYRAKMKDGTSIEVPLKPEECYGFRNQETSYLIWAIRKMGCDVNEIESVEQYFTLAETEHSVNVMLGV